MRKSGLWGCGVSFVVFLVGYAGAEDDVVSLREAMALQCLASSGWEVGYTLAASRLTGEENGEELFDETSENALQRISDRWNVKIALKGKSVYVSYPSESVPERYMGLDSRIVVPTPPPPEAEEFVRGERSLCGPNCLAILARAFGRPTPIDVIAKLAGTDEDAGTTLPALGGAARELGFEAVQLELSLDDYDTLNVPVIAHLDIEGKTHFVIFSKRNEDGTYLVLDPPNNADLTRERIEVLYTGHALLVTPKK